jgi:hypothetical protein
MNTSFVSMLSAVFRPNFVAHLLSLRDSAKEAARGARSLRTFRSAYSGSFEIRSKRASAAGTS